MTSSKSNNSNNSNSTNSRSANARTPKKATAKTGALKPAATGSRSVAWVVVAAVIIIAIVATGLFVLTNPGTGSQTTPFATFESNFAAANSVAIYVDSSNVSAYPSAIACATAMIVNIESNVATHKNASNIGFYVMNQTNCTYKEGGLGGVITNYTNSTPAACLALSTGMPRIFINYSSTNSTVIKPMSLYVSGTPSFLDECGVASEIR